MARIELVGSLGPEHSFRLDRRLDTLTERVRPHVTIDLRHVTDLHPSVVSVIIHHQRRAARLGGDVVVNAPDTGGARHVIDQIGLCRVTAPLAA